MTSATLAGFRARLTGGVYPAVVAGRPADFGFRDDKTMRHWPGDVFEPLAGLRGDAWNRDKPEAAITTLAALMSKDGGLVATVLFSPQLVLDTLLRSFGSSGQGLVDAWIAMCWTAEAAWRCLDGDLPDASGAGLLRPLAARLRFLVLGEPMRWRGKPGGTWWGWEPDLQFGGSGALDLTLGPDSWPVLTGRCQEARRQWRDYLDTYQSHPLLSQAEPAHLEQELRTLVFRDGSGRSLGLAVAPLAEPAPLTTEDKALIFDVVERHLLPRFAVPGVARLSLYDDGAWPRRWRALTGIAVVLAALTALGCAAALLVRQATVAAAACYLLLCAGVLLLPAGWGAMWLLRMPAASAVGIIALVSFLPGGWLGTPPRGWLAVVALVGVSFGYLLIEARNHGTGRGTAVARALLVAAIGAVHALMVSLIGLVAVAPAFVPNGARLNGLWTRPAYGHAGMVLALAAAWCLTVGVFSQILWDDRPITAPLAHLSWRNRLSQEERWNG